jgi:hypothetical protein
MHFLTNTQVKHKQAPMKKQKGLSQFEKLYRKQILCTAKPIVAMAIGRSKSYKAHLL